MYETIKNFIRETWASSWLQSTPSLAATLSNEGVNDALAESEWSGIERISGNGDFINSHGLWLTLGTGVLDGQLNSDECLLTASSRSGLEIPVLEDFISHRKSLAVPYRMLKSGERNPHFFGRKDALSLIDKVLLPENRLPTENSQGRLQTYAICGLGGVGKTELAREYTFSRQDQFDAVFWIEAEQTTQISEGFAVIASQLGYDDSSDKDRVVSRNLTLEWLNNPIKQRRNNASILLDDQSESNLATWLLVFNNADDLEVLQAFWPPSQRGSILITSRDPMAKQGGSGIDLEPFEPNEAAFLVRRLTQVSDSPENCETSLNLSIRLGGLPLAITQIAALIERLDMTLQEFLVYFDHQTNIAKVAKMKPIVLHDHYKHSLFTVWALESLSPQALTALQVLSFLNPDSIKESLISPPLPYEPPSNFPTTTDDYIMARLDLTKTSLVRRNKVSSQLTLHRLVQDVVRAQMTGDKTAQLLEFTARLVLDAWPTEFLRFNHDTAAWTFSEELLPHILRLQEYYGKHLEMIASPQAKKSLTKLLLFAGW